MSLQFLRANTETLRSAVRQCRYQVHIERTGKPPQDGDHDLQEHGDGLDETAMILAAVMDGHVVGTMRMNRLSDCHDYENIGLYGIDDFTLFSPVSLRTTLTTRLAVLKSHQNSGIFYGLVRASYLQRLELGTSVDFIDANAPRVRMFQRIGYRIHREGVKHPTFGTVTVLRGDSRDREHLRRVRSPLLTIVDGQTPYLRPQKIA